MEDLKKVKKKLYIQKRTKENIKSLFEYLKNKSCKECGETNQLLFDFHHKNPKDKKAKIAHLINRACWKLVLEEIEKCEILCCVCHRLYHLKETNNFRYNLWARHVSTDKE